MVLTAAQTTAFFENEHQMGIPHATVQLATEGIMSVIDLADFDKESLQQLADNLIRPGRVYDPSLLPNQGPRLQLSRVRATGKRNDFNVLLPISFSMILWLRRGGVEAREELG
jgi:hypothetical protein